MTIDEVMDSYNVSGKLLRRYESCGLFNDEGKEIGHWRYDERDIERISLIVTLQDIGFSDDEIEKYMKLEIKSMSSETGQLKMLNKKRTEKMDNIHLNEEQVEKLDYLRFKIKQKGNK